MRFKPIVTTMSVAVALLSCTAQAAPSYSVTDLGTLGRSTSGKNLSEAYGINDNGQIVGTTNIFGKDGVYGFLYSGGSMTSLGTLGGNSSRAYSINNSGQIAGSSSVTNSHVEHAFRYSGGMTDLGTLGGNNSRASGINDKGQVVGIAGTGAGYTEHAFVYSDSGMTDLSSQIDPLTGIAIYSADDINNSGQIVVTASLNNAAQHAYLYSGGSMTDLGTLGGVYSFPTSINESGQVVGYSQTADSGQHAFLYSDGNMIDLGALGGIDSSSSGYGINDRGQVVGNGRTPDLHSYGFLYSDGSMTDLNSLIDPLSGWTIVGARDINNNGQIAANGFHKTLGNWFVGNRALLLTPVPEPETYAMLLAGLGLVARQAWRRNNRPESRQNPDEPHNRRLTVGASLGKKSSATGS